MEQDVASVLSQFSVARSLMSVKDIRLAFSMPSVSLGLSCGVKNLMSVEVPSLSIDEAQGEDKYPYSLIGITSEADYSVELMGKVIVKLVKLAEIEKTTMMLANEIEKGKRRVNALENVLIPNIEETIRYISMKLEENERGATTRLMKVKSMLENRG